MHALGMLANILFAIPHRHLIVQKVGNIYQSPDKNPPSYRGIRLQSAVLTEAVHIHVKSTSDIA